MSVSVHPSRGTVYSYLILTTLLWGGSFLFTKIGLREVPPQLFVLARFSVATLIMLIVAAPRLAALNAATLRRGITVGLVLGLTNISFVFGLKDTSISRAGVLNNLFVLLIPIITRVLWKDRIGRTSMAGIAMAAAGIWLLATGSGAGFSRGDLVSLICAFFIACHIITVSKVLRDDDVYVVSLVQFATVACLAGATVLALPTTYAVPSLKGMATIAYCALFPTVICFTVQNAFQRYVTPTQAGLIYTLDPVWSLLAGFFILGERLNGREWLGCGLIFLAVLFPLAIRCLRERRPTEPYLEEEVVTASQ
ncbi:DMT family transporter [Geobacter sp. SVR]|uniref:DMT family transporter n=1 Tax=Geobacter sp. SVR TaxID=2495594 RepID=UPI00143F0250|nr:DMT family transporter [Geobacter sp. SVR]BCS53360.1 membrane protein [Geobacter sp. SVR]GCF85514.1 membrane protein [Geobacter sp. SVR]